MPVAQVVAVVALARLARNRAKVVEVTGSIGRVVLMVARGGYVLPL